MQARRTLLWILACVACALGTIWWSTRSVPSAAVLPPVPERAAHGARAGAELESSHAATSAESSAAASATRSAQATPAAPRITARRGRMSGRVVDEHGHGIAAAQLLLQLDPLAGIAAAAEADEGRVET